MDTWQADHRMARLAAQSMTLTARLDRGLERIQHAGPGDDLARWEALWCELLGEYRRTFDELEAMKGGKR